MADLDDAVELQSHPEAGASTPASITPQEPGDDAANVLDGFRLWIVTLGLSLSLMLAALDTTIISTALIAVSNSFGQFSESNWVVVAYLITYTGFLLIYAKFSDILGRKSMVLTGVVIFVVSSIGCSWCRTMTQLVIFRAFQGIGGAGIYSMTFVLIPEMVHPARHGLYAGLVSSIYAIASVLGPVLGGVIVDNTTWRWIFILNIPIGCLVLLVLAVAIPTNFPKKPGQSRETSHTWEQVSEKGARLDWPGALLSLTGSILLVFALEEGGTRYSWDGPVIVIALVVASLLIAALLLWEWCLSRHKKTTKEALLPFRLFSERRVGTVLLSSFLAGIPFIVIIINLPIRFQTVDDTSAQSAGILMLPMLMTSAVISGLVGWLLTISRFPPCNILIAAGALQLLGIGLMSSLSVTAVHTQPAQYGYQAILGLAFGTGISTMLLMTRLSVRKEDQAVAMGAVAYLRLLGGNIGLGFCSAILNHTLRTRLAKFLSEDEVTMLLQSTTKLPAGLSTEAGALIKEAFAAAFQRQMQVMTGISGITLLAMIATWERQPKTLA